MSVNQFWTDKHVIITGASSGIGHALAEHVAREGARVGLLARRQIPLEQLANRIRASAGRAATALGDVREAEAVRSAILSLEDELGPCDVIVANAGAHRYTPGSDFQAADFDFVFDTNVRGTVNSLAAVLPGMVRRRRGHVVAVASIAGMLGLPEVGAYSSSKAALITLMESLRVDLYPHGVRVTTICPGFIDTPFIAGHDRRVLKFMLSPEEAARRIARAIERGRAEYYFPWPTWLTARIASWLPFDLYRRLLAWQTPPAQVEQPGRES
ncbi:MAG: SDR family NAD(P)-dependent oxidoreductase [Phycisphaerae bacterium]|nr:SDR family NAD(P)-dependent oxidoreductase [Phycisphaerae bacterium]